MDATFDYIFVRQDDADVRTKGGVILPPRSEYDRNSAIGEPFTGVVLSTGWDVKSCKAGDRIIFDDMSLMYMAGDSEGEFLVMKGDDVAGVFKSRE